MSNYYRTLIKANAVNPPTGILLDNYPNASIAYSLRKISSNYTGSAIRVRRSSDNDLLNIGFVNDELDTTSLLNFVGSSSGFVEIWYDQSGNGIDAIQTANISYQPRIVNGGIVDTQNGKPAIMLSDLQSQYMSKLNVNLLNNKSNGILFGVYKPSTTNERQDAFIIEVGDSTSKSRFSIISNLTENNKFQLIVRRLDSDLSGILTSNATHDISRKLITAEMNYSTGTGILRQNGVEVASNNSLTSSGLTSPTSSDLIQVIPNGDQSGPSTIHGVEYRQEIIFYETDQTANIAGIENNINSYYNIY